MKACERRFDAANQLNAEAAKLGLVSLKNLIRMKKGAKIVKGPYFDDEPDVVIDLGKLQETSDGWMLPLNEETEHFVLFSEKETAKLAACGLKASEGSELNWNAILNCLVPADAEMAKKLEGIRRSFSLEKLDAAIEKEIKSLDEIVGAALGLSKADVSEIRRDMSEDPFLARVRPRYPFFRPRQYGRRKNLERSDRYGV
ncbi:hypothetical protein [Bradyrhizobium sp. B120]|uniref:hypothetical protein n=1 Tax=Bradyrhizobium sp. B120 TaxID=3410088 RepID=UPI003B98789F